MKLWKGRFQKEADPKTNDFNSSISIDSRMYHEDIEGSIAHATMLGECGIIDKSESEKIIAGLKAIRADLDSGALTIDPDAEDIHTFVEGEQNLDVFDFTLSAEDMGAIADLDEGESLFFSHYDPATVEMLTNMGKRK